MPPRIALSIMKGRAVKTPAFGKQLRKLRDSSRETRPDVCRGVARWGLTLDPTTLLQYERGTIAAPDPAILWALGRHYGLDTIDELLTVLVMDRTGRSLRAGVDIASTGFDLQQRSIAETFGAMPADVQTALTTIFRHLDASDLVALSTQLSPRRARRAR